MIGISLAVPTSHEAKHSAHEREQRGAGDTQHENRACDGCARCPRTVASPPNVPYTFFMPDRRWTYVVPPDLRPRLEAALSARHHGAAEVWAAVMEWMVEHEMPVPDSVRLTARPEEDVVIHRK